MNHLKVFIVQRVVFVQLVQVLGQLRGRFKIVHVDERLVRGATLVVFPPRSHHNGQDVVAQPVHVKLLRDVVHAVGVLKGQVELVLPIQQAETVVVRPGTLLRAALAVDVHRDVLREVLGVV